MSCRLTPKDLSAEQISDIRLAASKMTGATRRSFIADMTVKYCCSSPRQAETVFGWSKHTAATGLGEKRTGITCLGTQSACSGRIRWEQKEPEIAEKLRKLAVGHSQQDPSFRSSIMYTRLTAKAALYALRKMGFAEERLPSQSSMAEILNRMGFRLRKVLKAKPLKKLKETDAIFENIKKKTIRPKTI